MSHNKNVSQVNSAVVEAMDMYSTFELDQAIIGCLLEHHEMQFAHKKT